MRASDSRRSTEPSDQSLDCFAGLMDGAILVRSMALPTSKAPISLNFATMTTQRQKNKPKPGCRFHLDARKLDDSHEVRK